ncbi:hypothetical protein B0H21DRAFT_703012 [Amylocystis lapponica]|nr:hypothetical protein B0H21DRAFT_703012 [Amylocystis lapponica]
MASSPTREPTPEVIKTIVFAVSMTYYLAVDKPKTRGHAPKPAKDIKTKEITFAPSEGNYLEFLRAILKKHGETKYTVTKKQKFSFKYNHKGRVKNDHLDVDNESEYQDMVTKINTTNLDKIVVLVDINDIKKHCRRLTEDSLSPFEREIAHLRGILEKKYKNDHGGYAYVAPDGVGLELTPFRMREWAVAMHDGLASAAAPPNTEAFNPAKRSFSLLPARQQRLATAQPPQATAIPSGFEQMVNLITTVVSMAQGVPSVPLTPSPSTPKRQHRPVRAPSTPLRPSPSDLRKCLDYIDKHPELGLQAASQYYTALYAQGLGPDIIPSMSTHDLTSSPIKMKLGDVVRLKRGCEQWWDAPDGKRSCRRQEDDLFSPDQSAQEGPSVVKLVRYERRYNDNGCPGFSSWFAPPLVRNEDGESLEDSEDQSKLFYYDEARQEFVPVPAGYIVPANDEF